MKNLGIIVFCVAIIMILSPVIAKVVAPNDEEIMKKADPILDNILDGMKTKNYTSYSKDFDETMKKVVDEKAFLAANTQIESTMGEYKSRKYLGSLTKKDMTVALYKGVFSKSKDDILIILSLNENEKGKVEVSGLLFQ